MGGFSGKSEREVSVPAARAADPLQVIGESGRDGAKDHGREVADVDAHLEGRRGREQVHAPGRAKRPEVHLNVVAFFGRDERGVLFGMDAHRVGVVVPGGELLVCFFEPSLAARGEAGHLAPKLFGGAVGREIALTAAAAAPEAHSVPHFPVLQRHHPGRDRFRGPLSFDSSQQPRLLETAESVLQDVLCVEQRIKRREDFLSPALEPGFIGIHRGDVEFVRPVRIQGHRVRGPVAFAECGEHAAHVEGRVVALFALFKAPEVLFNGRKSYFGESLRVESSRELEAAKQPCKEIRSRALEFRGVLSPSDVVPLG